MLTGRNVHFMKIIFKKMATDITISMFVTKLFFGGGILLFHKLFAYNLFY